MKKITAFILAALLLAGCSERQLKPEKKQSEPRESSAVSSQQQPSSAETPKEPPKDSKITLANSYINILTSGKYYIDCTAVIEYEGMTMENPMLIAVDGENSSISVSSDLTGAMVTIRTLTYDGAVYMVNDEERSYMEMDESYSIGGFKTEFSNPQELAGGIEEFCGAPTEFISFDCDGDIIKLFFKGSSPVGIVRVADGDEENKTVLRINAISQNIPDKLVAMPIGYTKQ